MSADPTFNPRRLQLLPKPERLRYAEAVQLKLFQVERQIATLVGDLLERQRELRRCLRIIESDCQKKYRRCGREKPITEFYCEERYADGHRPYCKTCDGKRNTARAQQRKEAKAA